MKTFSRARAAKAALQKILDMHEASGEITTNEPEAGRFTATVAFAEAPSAELRADLTGFAATWKTTFVELPGGVDYPAPAPIDHAEGMDMGEELVSPAPVDLADPEVGKTPAAEEAPAPVKILGPTKRVWAIAESMPGAARKDVIAACVADGIALGTARTQYQHWFTAKKSS